MFRVYSIFYFFLQVTKFAKMGYTCDLFYLHKSFFATKKVMNSIQYCTYM